MYHMNPCMYPMFQPNNTTYKYPTKILFMMKYVKGLTLMNGGKDMNALVQTKACDVKSNRIVDINIRIKEKGVKIEVIIDTAVVLNQEMGDNMVSLPMFQNGSQIIQAYYNKKGEDQAYGGVGQLPNRGGKADTVVAKSLNKEFRPKINEQMQYCVNHPEEINKLAKVKAQQELGVTVVYENMLQSSEYSIKRLVLRVYVVEKMRENKNYNIEEEEQQDIFNDRLDDLDINIPDDDQTPTLVDATNMMGSSSQSTQSGNLQDDGTCFSIGIVFDLDKIPYQHAMESLRAQYSTKYGSKVYEHSSLYYSVEKYEMAYSRHITLVPPEESLVVPAELMGRLIPPPYIDPSTIKPGIKPSKRRLGVRESFSSRRNKCSICIEEKEEWSTGLELDTLLENATSERGLNEESHKVYDQNSKEEALTRETPSFYRSAPLTVVVLLDGGVGGRRNGTSGVYWWHWLVVFVVAVGGIGICAVCCIGKSKAEEIYQNNIEGGGQGSVDGDKENKSEKEEELESEKEKEDDHQHDFSGSPMGRELITTFQHDPIKLLVVHPWIMPTEQESVMTSYITLSYVDTIAYPTVELINKKLAGATAIRRTVRQGQPNVEALHDQATDVDPGASSGGVFSVGGRHTDASTTHDDNHVDS
ncbi:hypothetical protein FXO38_14303 [Capsicum annuum]|nr:hypothetical protein FXO38_14303 [Capsicum annuum]